MISFPHFQSYFKEALLVSYVTGAVTDVLVVVLTISRTGRIAWQSKAAGFSETLSFILFRDGE